MLRSALFFGFLWVGLLLVEAEKFCPHNSQFCYEPLEHPETWNATRAHCSRLGADLPGRSHLKELGRFFNQDRPYWTSLCFSNGQLQWLGANPIEESDLFLIDTLLPQLRAADTQKDQLLCFQANENKRNSARLFGLTLIESQQMLNGLCVFPNNRRVRYPTESEGRIVSVTAVTEGADIDWGPIGQNRDGFMNIFNPKSSSLSLKCDVKTSGDQNGLTIRWKRNGAYIGNSSQVIRFASENDLIPWIGLLSCEAAYGVNEPVTGRGFHLLMWNTVTARLVTSCDGCQLETVVEEAKMVLTQFVAKEIASGFEQSMEFYTEPPVITEPSISIMIHIRNKQIDKFDFKMAQRLGSHFQLSTWAKKNSIYLYTDIHLEIISPCNMALPQDRNSNISWIGYLGQTVPSGNFIGEPICVDERGDIIVRSCGIPERPVRFQECADLKPRREEPLCADGFVLNNGKCVRVTDVTDFDTALSQCWAGRPVLSEVLTPDNLADWVKLSRQLMQETRTSVSTRNPSLVWLPLRRLNNQTPLQMPLWMWTAESNLWIPQQDLWDEIEGSYDEERLCAAYDLKQNKILLQSCENRLPMVCNQPTLPQPISTLISAQPNHVAEFFCPPSWFSHLLVVDSGICYKRFTLKEAVDTDEAQQFCVQQGGHLATAPTHITRVSLEQVYAFFNSRSIVDSWIGLRNRGNQIGAFRWVNETADTQSSTFNWQAYNEFGMGYGVSTGISRSWWNWPREVKIWGLLCQKTEPNGKDRIRLQLESSSTNSYIEEGTYLLSFSSDPKPVPKKDPREVDEPVLPKIVNNSTNQLVSQLQPTIWPSKFDVVCQIRNFVRRFQFPSDFDRHHRILFSVPSSIKSGSLTCEAWVNQPAFRFRSNTIIHESFSEIKIPYIHDSTHKEKGYVSPPQYNRNGGHY